MGWIEGLYSEGPSDVRVLICVASCVQSKVFENCFSSYNFCV